MSTLTQSLLIYSVVISLGLFLGRIRIKGISLGVTWVLLIGLAASAFGFQVQGEVVHFLKDFGLVFFVYCIGLQVGPGFFASLRKSALHSNFLAAAIVLLGIILTWGFHSFCHQPISLMAGIMSGAVTNTPGLGAAQAAATDLHLDQNSGSLMALSYALTYPFGLGGLIISLLLLKSFLKIDLKSELEHDQHETQWQAQKAPSIHLTVENPGLDGQPLRTLFQQLGKPIVVSRMMHDGHIITPSADTPLHVGDTLLIVSPADQHESLKILVGSESLINLKNSPQSDLVSRILMVTQPHITHRRLGDLAEFQSHDFTLTRLSRAGIEMIPHGGIQLQLGDQLKVVGTRDGIEQATRTIGNSLHRLEVPDLAPIFIGIALGILLGSIPFYFPSIPVPIKLGTAGGPLIVSLMISKLGNKFYLNTYTTRSANLMVRELGISLFLASIGLSSGDQLTHALGSLTSLTWVGMGLTITILPLILVGMIAKIYFKKTYHEICGLLAGACTDPPALAFAMELTGSEAPSLVYATVYPLAMILRIIGAEALMIFFQ